ncbi:MAG: extracellular matrix/biofilm biosynthesis regulator RemA family protein [Chloroflexota bacterium]
MGIELVHVGFGNLVALNRVVAVLSAEQEPARRLIREAKDKGLLLDATHARKIKAALVMDTGHVTVVAIAPETIGGRLSSISTPAARREKAS